MTNRRNAHATLTYDIITPESAEQGDTSEHGFAVWGGYLYPISGDTQTADSVLTAARNGEFDVTIGEGVQLVMMHCAWEGQVGHNDIRCTVPEADYDEPRYTVHFDNLSAGTLARLARLLENNGVTFF